MSADPVLTRWLDRLERAARRLATLLEHRQTGSGTWWAMVVREVEGVAAVWRCRGKNTHHERSAP